MGSETTVVQEYYGNQEMVYVSIFILLALALLNVINYFFQRRQARALEGMRDIEQETYYFMVRKDREKDAQTALEGGGLDWIALQFRHALGRPVDLEGNTEIIKSFPVFTSVNKKGDIFIVSPMPRKSLLKALQALIKQGSSDSLADFLTEGDKAVLALVKSAKDEFVRSLTDDSYFDLHAAQAGKELEVDWSDSVELYFMTKFNEG